MKTLSALLFFSLTVETKMLILQPKNLIKNHATILKKTWRAWKDMPGDRSETDDLPNLGSADLLRKGQRCFEPVVSLLNDKQKMEAYTSRSGDRSACFRNLLEKPASLPCCFQGGPTQPKQQPAAEQDGQKSSGENEGLPVLSLGKS